MTLMRFLVASSLALEYGSPMAFVMSVLYFRNLYDYFLNLQDKLSLNDW